MDPNLRQQIDESHELLKGNLYPEDHVFRRKIDEAFLIRERPSKSEIYSVTDMFFKSRHSMPFSILAIYDIQFSIPEDIRDDWLAREVARMAHHLLYYPKLAYVNYLSYDGTYGQAIINFDDILKIDEYRSFWSDFSAGSKGSTGTDLTQLKEQLKQEVKLELTEQLEQEVKAKLKDQLKREVKAELKEQLKQEVKVELKDQLKQEVKVELKDQLKQEVKVELQDQLKQEVKVELKDQLKQEVKVELKDQLKQEVKVELKDQLDQEVKAKLKDQLKREVKQLKNQLKQELKQELKNQLKQEVQTEYQLDNIDLWA